MTVTFQRWAQEVRRLHHALVQLRPVAESVGIGPPEGEEWFELLERKLLPQVTEAPLLIVAVVGGTNIGKSVIFNHLAGENASGVSPLAAGTKQPVCLVPPGSDDPDRLARLFEGFKLLRWESSADPLTASEEDLLFWRVSPAMPERLLLLDTPDIDSDAAVNWARADHIRQVADVLIAVLTQQKYNDAAVKEFFRKAAAAEKSIVIVFNQCDLADDREFWPLWLATFTSETGANPQSVYVVPHDRAAAGQLRLSFYEVGPDGRAPLDKSSSLRDELSELHFDAIKIRTLRGALAEVIEPTRGVGSYLQRVRAASGQFQAAAGALSSNAMARVQWPSLPSQVLVDEIRAWWDARRSSWSRSVHGFYRTIGEGVSWPVRTAWQSLRGTPEDPIEVFRARERDAIVRALETLIDELDRLSRVGNDTLRPRLAKLLQGGARGELLARIQAEHAQLPAVDADYRQYLRAELDVWGRENPRAVAFLRSVDHVLAIARPAVTVSLAVSGWFVAASIVHDVAVQTAGHTVGQLATEAAITGGITSGGEALVNTTGDTVQRAATRLFRRLQSGYAERRAQWLADWLERNLLGDLLSELRRGAEAPESEAFRAVQAALPLAAQNLHADR